MLCSCLTLCTCVSYVFVLFWFVSLCLFACLFPKYIERMRVMSRMDVEVGNICEEMEEGKETLIRTFL